MIRKLVKQGAATMMISLPTKWIKDNKLGKGSEVNLVEKDNSIEISTNGYDEIIKSKLDISDTYPISNRLVLSEYIRGVDELELTFSKKEELKEIQTHVLKELIGFEIIKQSQNSATIKDITGLENQDADELIRRIFYILDSMFDEMISAIENNKKLDVVIESDEAINRFSSFCLRLLNKKGYKNYSKTKAVYFMVSSLEEIGDICKSFSREYNGKTKILKERLEIIKEIKKFLQEFKELFFNFERTKHLAFARKYKKIKEKIDVKDPSDLYLRDILKYIIRMTGYLMSS